MARPPRNIDPSRTQAHPKLQTEDVLQAIGGVLAPLIRLLLASGVDYTKLAAELKPIFVEQARLELSRIGSKDTDSAISLLSGVHRKDVRKWREAGQLESRSKAASLSAQIYARWVQDKAYMDRRRRPKPLPRLGPYPSFETLSRSVTQDVHPYTVLAELIRLGLVHLENRHGVELVIPNKLGFVPAHGTQEILELFGGNLSDHATAAVTNLLGQPAHIEQSVFADGITAESAEKLAELARKLWAQARSEMIAQASNLYEQDKNQSSATHRMRFGAYFWEEGMAPDTDIEVGGNK